MMESQLKVMIREILNETISAYVKELVKEVLKDQMKEMVTSTVEMYTSSKKLKLNAMASYNWDELELGRSFAIKTTEIKEQYLRNKISIVGKKLGRKFSVTNHKDAGYYEVARVK